MSIRKVLDDITADDLQEIVDTRRPEDLTTEYKEALPAEWGDLCRDVAAFANSSGGDLIVGIKCGSGEDKGMPVEVVGMSLNRDGVMLQIENALRDRVEPRLDVSTKFVERNDGSWGLVMRVPRSYDRPHAVRAKGGNYVFMMRNNAGTYPMDVRQIRGAFLMSEASAERLRAFRDGRIAQIIQDRADLPPNRASALVWHVLPVGAFEGAGAAALARLWSPEIAFMIQQTWGRELRYNFDGVYAERRFGGPEQGYTYIQVYANGMVEAVEAHSFGGPDSVVDATWLVNKVKDQFSALLAGMEAINVDPPAYVSLSALDMNGSKIVTHGTAMRLAMAQPIDRSKMVMPEALVESWRDGTNAILKPILDALFRASGWSECSLIDGRTPS